MIALQRRWFCLRARPRREHLAAQHLVERTGVEVFAPRLAIRRARRNGEAMVTVEPLFPGYLFARFVYGDDLRFVCSTQDVSGIVHFGDHTPPVPDDLIDFLREQVTTTHIAAPILVAGDWVEVLTGCLAGSEGRVVSFDNAKSRAWVLLSLLGQDVRISLPAATLRRAGPTFIDFPPQLLAGSS
jgi:transcriptional antiterminator RfaH